LKREVWGGVSWGKNRRGGRPASCRVRGISKVVVPPKQQKKLGCGKVSKKQAETKKRRKGNGRQNEQKKRRGQKRIGLALLGKKSLDRLKTPDTVGEMRKPVVPGECGGLNSQWANSNQKTSPAAKPPNARKHHAERT